MIIVSSAVFVIFISRTINVFGCRTSSPKRVCTAAYRRRPRLTSTAHFSGFYRLGGVALRKPFRVFGATCRSWFSSFVPKRRSPSISVDHPNPPSTGAPEQPSSYACRYFVVFWFFVYFCFLRCRCNWTMTSQHSYWLTLCVHVYVYVPYRRKQPLNKLDRWLLIQRSRLKKHSVNKHLIFFNYLICSANPSPAVISRVTAPNLGG